MSIDPAVTPADYQYVRHLVREGSGLVLSEGKEYLVRARLGPIAQREGVSTLTELIVRIRSNGQGLRDAVVEAMATNETSFFRDVSTFDVLRDDVIPAVLRANGAAGLRMWSAAASTGQEAYSLAILVNSRFPNSAPVSILASDFSRDVLARAEAGAYTQMEVNRGLPAANLVRYFRKDGLRWKVSDALRRMVTFREINLVRPLPLMPAVDIVLLRNVLIYFDAEAKADVLNRVAGAMRKGAYLFLGSAESTRGIDDRFERVPGLRAACYRRKGGI